MILNYIRKKIYQRTHFARQVWEPRNKSFKSNLFNELNFQYRRYGNKNPNKFFYLIKRSPGAGFFSNLSFVIHNLYICDQLKAIPIVDMENYQTFYNCKNKINNNFNSWNYYFKPVSKYQLSEVYKSKNIIICDSKTSVGGYNLKNYRSTFRFFNGFQFFDQRHKKIIKKYIRINNEIKNEAAKIEKKFNKKKILGICFRGSDLKKSAYQPHALTKKQMIYATEKLLKKYKFDKIYLCTEDVDYLQFYKERYSDILIYNKNSPRTTDSRDLFDYDQKNHRYLVGRGNIVDMLVLSKTTHMLFGVSNIPYTALFFASKKIPHSVIDNGMRGGLIKSLFSYRLKELLPYYLGGFKNHIITKNKLIKNKKSDFEIL